jgi:hypothetical protein
MGHSGNNHKNFVFLQKLRIYKNFVFMKNGSQRESILVNLLTTDRNMLTFMKMTRGKHAMSSKLLQGPKTSQ